MHIRTYFKEDMSRGDVSAQLKVKINVPRRIIFSSEMILFCFVLSSRIGIIYKPSSINYINIFIMEEFLVC